MTRPGEGSDDGDLRRRFRQHLRSNPELIPPGSTVVVAVSGGPDSMALLDLLHREEDAAGTVIAAHFDHALRPESDREARRVVRWCQEEGIPWVAAGPARPLDADPAACRRARYRFLGRVRRDAGARRLATAHHADDQCETVLFRILRGTGLRGLAGMPPLRDTLVRPLLPFRGGELESYASRRGLPFHRDPSNRDPAFARSRIRHRLLPALEARHERENRESGDEGGIRERLLEVSRLARETETSLERLTERVVEACRLPGAEEPPGPRLRLRRGPLASLDPELLARVLRRVARERNVRLTRGGTRSGIQFITDARSGARTELGGGLVLGRDFDIVWFHRDPDPPGDDREVSLRLPGEGRGAARIGGARYRVSWGPHPPGRGAGGGRALRLDPDAIGRQLELRVRGWKPGDRIRLPAGTRKLKDVFVDRRVPRSLRSTLAVVAGPDGDVRWVPGVCTVEGWTEETASADPRVERDGWWLVIADDQGEGPGAS